MGNSFRLDIDIATKKKLILLHANNKGPDLPVHLHRLISQTIISLLSKGYIN